MQVEKITAKGQLVPLMFSEDAVAASQTNAQLKLMAVDVLTNLVEGYSMPFAGSIVAVSVNLDAAASAGSLTAGGTIGGTEDADTTVTITTEAVKSKVVGRYLAEFAKDAIIGCEITTDASWNGTASDMVVIVWVLLQMVGI